MDYEQKYEQKYKKTLEWIQSLYDGLHGATKEDAEHYFPELKESEDERIRKEIIDFLELPHPQFVGKRDREKWIAWLEKQGKIVDCQQNHQDVKHPNGGIVMEDFNGGEGFYKLHLDYLSKKQVEEVEEMVRTWNKESKTSNENTKNCVEMCLTDANEQRFEDFGTTLKDCLAWLERQGNKFVNIDVESMVSSYEQKLESQGGTKYTPLVNMCLTAFRHGIENVLEELNLKKLEKQGEQKHFSDFKAKDWYVSKVDGKIHNMTYNPTDKVEPKFKIGNWFVNNRRKDVFLIKSITNGYCTLEDIKGNIISPCLPPCESDSHIWTIGDAKDGDVLVDEDNNIGIYIGKNDDFWHSCIYLGCDGCLHDINIGAYHKHNNTKPATKEQRNLLFQKMKEEGYEWDAQKKEVKKPTDEIEPKFKIGNWITDGRLTCKVLSVTGKSYELHLHNDDYCHFETDVQSVDKRYHLWTIQDAMDGDVLVGKDDRPFIFTGEFDVQDDNPTAYCGINSDDKFITGKGSHWTFKDGIKPATKEQRDLLFSKMKEAGCEWDAEKKELKKMESKTLNADNVVKWLNDQACLGWLEDVEVEKVVEQFKKDFGL